MKHLKIGDLPKHFDHISATKSLVAFWDENRVYEFDPEAEETFSVDTPPPTVSGSLHAGHIFSYTHTDIIARYKRMTGKSVFYPMGWDDNGLPTERRVENYYRITCDRNTPYDPELKPTDVPVDKKQLRRPVSRRNFIEHCRRLTDIDEKAFKSLWRRVGLSIDWDKEYATIDHRSIAAAQHSFLDLYEKGHVYSGFSPVMWDTTYNTAVAQAESEERRIEGAYHHIRFALADSGDTFVIATTRPELLPACVGVTAHPDDKRYQQYFGRKAITPLFEVPVPIFPSAIADTEKGTGILMVCTFGDATDVAWQRQMKLPLRQVLDFSGRMAIPAFGSDDFPSRNTNSANEYAAKLQGLPVHQARDVMASMLKDARAMQSDSQRIEHMVKFYEKGSRPLELISTRQWFVRLMDKKEMLLKQGQEVHWYPGHMLRRYENWVTGLQFDWCISRQRYFGAPIPVWFPLDDKGEPMYNACILPAAETLPVDPLIDTPEGFAQNQRNHPGGFTAETDIFDTWFTSSLSPQLSGWYSRTENSSPQPMDIRPQSHEIIRTWTFYTIVKSALHHNCIPWRNVLISGWILDPDRKKMSKSSGNAGTPTKLIERYSSDGVRYWSAMARLGVDTALDERSMKSGLRLVTKIYNASKFVLSLPCESASLPTNCNEPIDRSFLSTLADVAASADEELARYEFARALDVIETFFWNSFTDSYLELVKSRAKASEESPEEAASAVFTLRMGLNILLRLFAPFLPFVTDHIWQWIFAAEKNTPSIHLAPWPGSAELDRIDTSCGEEPFKAARECLRLIHREKTAAGKSVGSEIEYLKLGCPDNRQEVLVTIIDDLKAAGRISEMEVVTGDTRNTQDISIVDIRL